MTETDLWQTLRGARGLDRAHMTRIENSTGYGVPDISMAYEGREAWVELKIFRSGRLHFRTSQRDWIQIRREHRSNIVVLARDIDEITLWDPDQLLKLPAKVENPGKSFSVKPVRGQIGADGCSLITNKRFDWEAVLRNIFR